MRRNHNALRSTRPKAGVAALLVTLLAATAAGCDDGGAAASDTSGPSAAVTTLDEWCGVVRDVGVILDANTFEGPLDEVQPPQAEVLALIDQLLVGIDVIEEDFRDDVRTLLEAQQKLSQIVVDATDEAAMRAAIDEATSQEVVVDESTYEWVGTTCGLIEAPDAAPEASSDEPAVEAASHGNVSVILDQSPTVSDIGALGFLAARTDVDLLAVTMPGTGEADCARGAVTTRAVLDAAGLSDVAIGCGGVPLEGINEWPQEWREASDGLAEIVAPGVADTTFYDAESVLLSEIASASEPVTIVALGPLTNIAAVLETDPSLANNIERIVIMGGAVSVPGNVEPELTAEWNLHADPGAAKSVIESGIPVSLVALDATDHVPLTSEYIAGVAAIDNDLAAVETAVLGSLPSLDFFFMWDELAAVLTVQPEVATWSERSIVVEADGSTVESPDGTAVQVAVDADAASVRSLLLGALSEFGR